MNDHLQARDGCEQQVFAAIDALAIVLGIGAGGLTAATRAERAAALADAARAIAAAQAANDRARPAAPDADTRRLDGAEVPGDVERALRRMAGEASGSEPRGDARKL